MLKNSSCVALLWFLPALCGGCITKASAVYVVKIEGTLQPFFSERCVVCAGLGSEIPVSLQVGDEQGRVDFYFYGFPVSPSQGPLLTIPIHDSCARGVRNDFLKRLALIILLAAGITALGMYMRHGLLGLTAAVLVGVPLLYMQLMKPVPFEFYRTPNGYVLMFANQEYAREFALHYGVAVEKCEYSGTSTPTKP